MPFKSFSKPAQTVVLDHMRGCIVELEMFVSALFADDDVEGAESYHSVVHDKVKRVRELFDRIHPEIKAAEEKRERANAERINMLNYALEELFEPPQPPREAHSITLAPIARAQGRNAPHGAGNGDCARD
ncbi:MULTISPECIES: hypothetical protein [Mesorhizobium]|uniref:Uncharacterized protein n=1 Tax=Mesorhizobium denitrificans TaxID=2294114 RepID=A0A371XG44_9HYPH|nr:MULTISPECIES: hypothetical protein [Mesorhizobium]RFC68153.1 hypothetical protein DY251_07715 [Mesorhizobium denitrificans]